MRKAQIFILVVVVLVAGAFFVPVTMAEAMSACQIVNAASAEVFDNLQVAVDAAAPGDQLTVTGTCVGTTIIDKDLVIEGDSAPESEQATLDGNGAGSVLTVAIDVNVTVTGLTITGGYSEFGGGIYNEGAMELNEVTVSDNASNYEGWLGGGGGIYNLDTMTLKNSVVTNNTAVSQGGGIYNKNGGKMNLNNSVVGGNLSTHINYGNGGGIYNDNYYAGTWIRLQNSIVVGNRAESLGGGISTYGFLMLSRSKVTNNTAGRWGGGVFTGAGTNTTIRTTMIRGNSASLSGGGIYAAGRLDVADSEISDNRAGEDGGGISASSTDIRSTLLLTRTTIRNNVAHGLGGGLYAYDSGYGLLVVEMTDSTVSSNNSSASGGGIFNSTNDYGDVGGMTLNNSLVNDNEADHHGGGIYNLGDLTLNNATVTGNLTGDGGGGIYNDRGASSMTLNESTVSDNSANDGAGMYNNAATGYVTLNDSTIDGNTASRHGGGILNAGTGDVIVNDSIVSDNTATDTGGGVYNGFEGAISFVGSMVNSNSAASAGGVYNDIGEVTFDDTSTVSGNSEPQCVGVVCPIVE